MIADLHCHYPMHLVADEPDPEGPTDAWTRQFIDTGPDPDGPREPLLLRLVRQLIYKVEACILDLAARIVNDSGWSEGWRIKNVDGLEKGGAEIVCSVVYWPASEFDLPRLNDEPPLDAYFERIKGQLQFIENGLPSQTADGTPVFVAKTATDLTRRGIRFVHCVEGGFQLGDDEAGLDARVQWLSEHGVLYITVAHLFYRELATEAPAIPHLTDRQFRCVFHEPRGVGLTPLGEKVIEAMYRHKILIDISHMSERAVNQTFELVKRLDGGEVKPGYPIIATHVGMQSAGPAARAQEYNLSDNTAQKIAEREGVIGLITAQHQLGDTPEEADSATLIKAHLDAIGAAVGDASRVAALGSDIDGFIKPTLKGFEKAEDFAKLEAWVRAAGQRDPEAILHGNAERVITAAFDGR